MHIEGGTVGPLTGIKGLSLRMYTPLDHPTIEIRSLQLTQDNPGNAYLDTIPYIDRFGQWTRAEYEGKIHSEAELRRAWATEDSLLEVSGSPYAASMYGGFSALDRQEATGFFRVAKLNGKWWFVDPEGYLFLSVGVNGLGPGGGGSYSRAPGLERLYEVQPATVNPAGNTPQAGPMGGNRRGGGGFGGFGGSFGQQNQQLRYGNDGNWREAWNEQTVKRMHAWGLNTGGNGAPYMGYMNVRVPSIAGLQDVYSDDFEQQVDNALRNNLTANRDNPLLIGYFSGNEPAWLFHEDRVC